MTGKEASNHEFVFSATKTWESKFKINVFGFLLRNPLLLRILHLCLFIYSSVNIVFYIKQFIFLQSISLLHVF